MKNSKKTAQKCWKTIEMAKRKHIEFGVSEKATLLICERARRTMNESVVNWQASKVIPIWNNSLLRAECFLVQLHRSERIFSLALCVSLRFFFFHSFSSVYRSFSWWFLLGKHTSSWFDGPLNSSLFYTVFRLDSVFFHFCGSSNDSGCARDHCWCVDSFDESVSFSVSLVLSPFQPSPYTSALSC